MIGVAHIALFLGFVALTIYGILNAKANKKLYTISLSLTVLLTLIPINGNPAGTLTYYYFGFPSMILEYHGGWDILFNPIGYLFNFFVFYWLLRLFVWVLKDFSIIKPSKQQ